MQWIIAVTMVLLAASYLLWRIVRVFRAKGCSTGCGSKGCGNGTKQETLIPSLSIKGR